MATGTSFIQSSFSFSRTSMWIHPCLFDKFDKPSVEGSVFTSSVPTGDFSSCLSIEGSFFFRLFKKATVSGPTNKMNSTIICCTVCENCEFCFVIIYMYMWHRLQKNDVLSVLIRKAPLSIQLLCTRSQWNMICSNARNHMYAIYLLAL